MNRFAGTIDLPHAWGAPPLRGRLRCVPEDFEVDEDLGFEPDGAGEHVLVRIEKRGANTEWAARALARFASVAPGSVIYAGLKDRHALARQTFSLHLPGRGDPDWSEFKAEGLRVLSASRHGRKLKRGALKGNRFRIVVRDVQGDRDAADRVIDEIARSGVPNYFGEQRFGRDADNIERARLMFNRESPSQVPARPCADFSKKLRVRRHERSILLSAARSQLFNAVLAARIERGDWNRPLQGEVWMLGGSHSIFGPEPLNEALVARHATGDIDLTGPMWGAGELRSAGPVAELESAVAKADADLAGGLARAGLNQQRRALRLRPRELTARWVDEACLELRFYLQSGSYATVVTREICGTDELESSPTSEDTK